MASTSVHSAVLVLSAFSAVCHGASVIREWDAVPAGYVAEGYYPSPHGGWTSDWSASYSKAEALVQQMTLAEKTNITAGTGIYMGKSHYYMIVVYEVCTNT
jgi:beta-glucosidase